MIAWRILFTSWQGRALRREFWVGSLVLMLPGLVRIEPALMTWLIAGLSVYAGLCLQAKRLHDIGVRATWMFALLVLPAALGGALLLHPMSFAFVADRGGITLAPADSAGRTMLFSILGMYVVWLGLLAFWPGQRGGNRFGPARHEPLFQTFPASA